MRALPHRAVRHVAAGLVLTVGTMLAACAAPPAGPTPPNPPTPPTPPTVPELPAGPGAWQTLPGTGLDRQEVSFVHVDGTLYLAGGATAHQAYDPVTQTWTNVAAFPYWHDHVQAVVVDGLVYHVGGLAGWPDPHIDTVTIYDPAANAYDTGTPMPRGRGGGGVAAHGGLIYYAGGLADGVTVDWFDVYDPATGAWTQLPDMPHARDHFHATVVDGRFYAIGGRESSTGGWPTVPHVDVYDFGSGAWTTLDTQIPTPRGGFAAAVLGREILIIGGESGALGSGTTHDQVEAFDTTTETWRTLAPMPTARHGIQAAVCDGTVFIAAGGTSIGHQPTSTFEAFRFDDEPAGCGAGSFSSIAWSTAAAAPSPGTMEAQGIAVGDRLYVFGGYTSWVPDPFCVTDRSMAYDVPSGTWTELAPIPAGWTHAGAAHHAGSIYLAGGRALDACTTDLLQETSSDRVLRYEIATDTWHEDVPPLPEGRSAGGLVRVGSNLHYFGGVSSGHGATHAAHYEEEADHWVLALDGGTAWEPRAPLPNPRNHMAAVAVGGQIYAIGGQYGEGGHAQTVDLVHRYDPASDTWHAATSLPAPLSHMTPSTMTIGDRVLVVGGERMHGQPVADVWLFDPSDETWSEMDPLPVPRRSGVAGYAGGRVIWAVGGGAFSTNTYQGTLQR